MNILFLVLEASDGGHARSAQIIAREFARTGDEVCLVTGPRTLNDPGGLECLAIPTVSRNPLCEPRVVHRLHRLIDERGVDVVHAFDHRSSLTAFWLALKTGVRVTHTICGGTQRFSARYLPEIAVFSDELRDGYTADDRNHVHVIPNRISFSAMESQLRREEVLSELGLEPGRPTILVVCRLGQQKIVQVERSLELFLELQQVRPELQLLIVGANQIGDISVLQRRVDGCEGVALDTERYVHCAWQLNPCADIVWGVGRSLYEGMFFGKPVFLMASFALAGMVTPERRTAFFRTNFSGRSVPELTVPQHIAEHVRILDEPEFAAELVADNRCWLRENLDVTAAPDRYRPLYREVPHGWWRRVPMVLGLHAWLLVGRGVSHLRTRSAR